MNRDGGALDARTWPDAGDATTTHIDVRGLARPLPLMRILELVHRLPAGSQVIVHHDRDPLGLYPELAQIGWWAEPIPGEPGEVRLRLRREDT